MNRFGVAARAAAMPASLGGVGGEAVVDVGGGVLPDADVVVLVVVELLELAAEEVAGVLQRPRTGPGTWARTSTS